MLCRMVEAVTSGNVRVDGVVRYRTDRFGSRVAILPATCRRGHSLGLAHYRARESNGIIRVRCDTCAAAGLPNPHWTLRSIGPIANVAELDDQPYQVP